MRFLRCVLIIQVVVLVGVGRLLAGPVSETGARQPKAAMEKFEMTSSLIPLPNEIELADGVCVLDGNSAMAAPKDAPAKLVLGGIVQIERLAGLRLKTAVAPVAGTRCIQWKRDEKIPAEGYRLTVTPEGVTLAASSDAGWLYGVQTLTQLLVDGAKTAGNDKAVAIEIPCVTIADAPRFAYRGFLLDSARHFQSVETIKRYLDLMAFYKLNKFHWHLTDDSAWRIEIAKYPKLTAVGAFPGKDGQEVNGFYTKVQIREIVAYAKERFITVIPEVDMPGHATAALFSYPEYSCKEGPFKRGKPGMLSFQKGVGQRLAFCAGNDATLGFLKDVLDEVMELFPGPIHIGGDERPKGNWSGCPKCQARMKALKLSKEDMLQNWLMAEINKHLVAGKRRSMAWAENIKGGVPEGQIVQAWHGGEDVKAVEAGRQVVNSIHNFTYLDYPSHGGQKPSHAKWMPVMGIGRVYNLDPHHRKFPKDKRHLVLGVEAPIWTEGVLTNRLDFKVFPRLLATVEVAWTQRPAKNFRRFMDRLRNHTAILKKLGVRYDDTLPEFKE